MLRENPKTEKGEYCLVLDLHGTEKPAEEAPPAEITLEARLIEEIFSGGMSLRDAQNELVLKGEKKNAVKQAALNLKKLFEV